MMIVKIGGGASINLEEIVKDLAQYKQPFLVVHGANALRDSLAKKLCTTITTLESASGISSVQSDEELIDLMCMSYAGLRNKRLVELFQRHGVNAIGLSGIDGQLIRGERNAGIRVRQNGKTIMVRDFSGKPRSVNQQLLQMLLDNGYVPVITVPILDADGYAINSENDDIVALLQVACKADTVVQFIEAPGFLNNAEDSGSVIAKLTRSELAARESTAQGRFRRKLMAISRLLTTSESKVVIADGRVTNPLQRALEGQGTVIQ